MNLKKNNFAFLMMLALILLNSCSYESDSSNNDSLPTNDTIKPYHSDLLKSNEINEYITINNISTDSFLYNPENLYNSSGMSGNYSYSHTHSFENPRENMFLSKANYIIIELKDIAQLGHLYIWNYNNFKYITSSVKKISIEYSLDGTNYVNFEGNYELSKNDGKNNCSYSLINENEYLDLQGITANYLKINFIENYGGIYNGLSEIRLYKYQNEIKEGNEITATIFKNNNSYINKKNSYVCTNVALDKKNTLDALASNNQNLMYKSANKEITFYFDGNYPLSKIGIWNYNDYNNLNCGIKNIEISYSLNGKEFHLIGNYKLNKATGKNNEKVSNIIEFDTIQAQYVRIKYLENYGGLDYGLTGVKFILGKGYVSKENVFYSGLFSSYNGWTGADGIFGVNLDGNQSISGKKDTFFNFSDTYIGTVNPINKHRQNYYLKNNSFAYFANDTIDFIIDNEVIGVDKMESRSNSDAFAWLGDGFVANNKYYVSRLYITKEGVLGFSQKGEDLVSFDIIDGKIDFSTRKDIIDTNTNKLSYFSNNKSIIFGSAYFENTINSSTLNPDGYIYNFGYLDEEGKRMLVCSRFKEEDVENFEKYEYLSDTGWTNSIETVKGLIDHVSCEMSVIEINDPNSKYYGKFMLTFQKDTIGNEICVSLANSLFESFQDSYIIYSAKETLLTKGLSQYNAKMHPTLSYPNRYVISYNLNESGSNINATNGDIYHPRFIELFII